MEVALHEGPEVVQTSDLEVVHNGQQQYAASNGKFYTGADGTYGGLAPSPKKRICGLSKAIFWLAAALTVLALVVVGVAIGLGVELSKAQNANGSKGALTSSTSTVPAASSSPPSSAPASAGTTSTIPSTPTSTGGALPSNICPGANNTVVTTGLGSVQYLVACDSDFGGSGKETLSSFVVDTWDDCVDLCNTMNYFQSRTDVGCTWNVEGTGTQTPGTCWCLGGASKTVVSNPGNVAGVPQ